MLVPVLTRVIIVRSVISQKTRTSNFKLLKFRVSVYICMDVLSHFYVMWTSRKQFHIEFIYGCKIVHFQIIHVLKKKKRSRKCVLPSTKDHIIRTANSTTSDIVLFQISLLAHTASITFHHLPFQICMWTWHISQVISSSAFLWLA